MHSDTLTSEKIRLIKDLFKRAEDELERQLDEMMEEYWHSLMKEVAIGENNRNRHGVEWPNY